MHHQGWSAVVNNCDPFHRRHPQKAGASAAQGEVRSDVSSPALYLEQVRGYRLAKVHGSPWEVAAAPGPLVELRLCQVRRPQGDC